MNGVIVLSSRGGMMLFSQSYRTNFGIGSAGENTLQLSSALFALCQMATNCSVNEGLSSITVGVTSIHFKCEIAAHIMVVIFLDKNIQKPHADRIVNKLHEFFVQFDLNKESLPLKKGTKKLLTSQLQTAMCSITGDLVCACLGLSTAAGSTGDLWHICLRNDSLSSPSPESRGVDNGSCGVSDNWLENQWDQQSRGSHMGNNKANLQASRPAEQVIHPPAHSSSLPPIDRHRAVATESLTRGQSRSTGGVTGLFSRLFLGLKPLSSAPTQTPIPCGEVTERSSELQLSTVSSTSSYIVLTMVNSTSPLLVSSGGTGFIENSSRLKQVLHSLSTDRSAVMQSSLGQSSTREHGRHIFRATLRSDSDVVTVQPVPCSGVVGPVSEPLEGTAVTSSWMLWRRGVVTGGSAGDDTAATGIPPTSTFLAGPVFVLAFGDLSVAVERCPVADSTAEELHAACPCPLVVASPVDLLTLRVWCKRSVQSNMLRHAAARTIDVCC